MNPWEMIDHVADLVLATQPSDQGERLMRVVMSFTGGQSAALFERRQEDLALLASRGVDQVVLEAVDALWAQRRAELASGRPVVVPAPEPAGARRSERPSSAVLYPVSDDAHLLGLLYAESRYRQLGDPRELRALSQFARLGARVLLRRTGPASEPTQTLSTFVEATPLGEIARDQLLVLLDRHEWNIARVARLMGVTRPTVYKRLERYGIPRQHVPKGRRQVV